MSAGMLLTARRAMTQQMRHTCTIQRTTAATYDTPASNAAHLSNQPCIFGTRQADERADEGGVREVKRSFLLLPIGTDVQNMDRVTSVVDQFGVQRLTHPASVDGDPFVYATHLDATLSGVN